MDITQKILKLTEEAHKNMQQQDMNNNMINERKKLAAFLGNEMVYCLTKSEAFIAGGAITSIFTRKDINDIDVYFRDKDKYIEFIMRAVGDKTILSITKNSITFKYNNLTIQAICFKYFNDHKDIFDAFDFTVCMGCFDFKDCQFYLHKDFLKHNSQRILKFNKKTTSPLKSILRLKKYKNKGYEIKDSELLRIIMSCMKLEINSIDDLKEEIGGEYGISDIDIPYYKEGEFNLDDVIDSLLLQEFNFEDSYKKFASTLNVNKFEALYMTIRYKHDLIKTPLGYFYKDINNELKRIDRYISETHYNIINIIKKFSHNSKFIKLVGKDSDGYYDIDSKERYILGEENNENITIRGIIKHLNINPKTRVFMEFEITENSKLLEITDYGYIVFNSLKPKRILEQPKYIIYNI